MQNDDNNFTRPLGATPPNIQRAIDGGNADLKEGRGEGIALPRDTAAPLTLMSESDTTKKGRKRSPSVVRRQKGETLHADARLRIYKTGHGNDVRVVLSGARSGISVEATTNGNIMMVMVTLARLWLRGASMLAKDTARDA